MRGGRREGIFSPAIQMTRGIPDLFNATAADWAPRFGPVRPILQLMSVLPPRRCVGVLFLCWQACYARVSVNVHLQYWQVSLCPVYKRRSRGKRGPTTPHSAAHHERAARRIANSSVGGAACLGVRGIYNVDIYLGRKTCVVVL
jgi:hypothetical protein